MYAEESSLITEIYSEFRYCVGHAICAGFSVVNAMIATWAKGDQSSDHSDSFELNCPNVALSLFGSQISSRALIVAPLFLLKAARSPITR